MKTIAVIMAGGSGVRFWPRSRKKNPKQLLALTTDQPMLLEALERTKGLVRSKDVWVVAGEPLGRPIKKVLGKKGVFLAEPAAKNTAACIGLATAKALKENGDAVLAIFPADHHIANPAVFKRELKAAVKRAERNDEIITLGIRPTHPATGYGYIKMGKRLTNGFYKTDFFVEKPSLARAKNYLKTKNYLWNAGIFVARASVLGGAISAFMPDLERTLSLWVKNKKKGEAAYKRLKPLSIDYGVMEKARNVVVLPSKAVWSDVGSWPSLGSFLKQDKKGNAVHGEFLGLEAEGCLASSDTGIIAAVGVKDLVIVRSGDAVLVCPKEKDQEIRRLVGQLQEQYK